jgi:hypothetical protein
MLCRVGFQGLKAKRLQDWESPWRIRESIKLLKTRQSSGLKTLGRLPNYSAWYRSTMETPKGNVIMISVAHMCTYTQRHTFTCRTSWCALKSRKWSFALVTGVCGALLIASSMATLHPKLHNYWLFARNSHELNGVKQQVTGRPNWLRVGLGFPS